MARWFIFYRNNVSDRLDEESELEDWLVVNQPFASLEECVTFCEEHHMEYGFRETCFIDVDKLDKESN